MLRVMSETLRKAFERIAAELPEYEQEQFSQWVLSMIESDERDWDVQFAASLDKLAQLADQALAEYHQGRTEVLGPKKL
jgi:hypothetical protein